MSNPSPQMVPALDRLIETTLDYQAAMQKLNQFRNRHAAIRRLPNEVLSMIFLYAGNSSNHKTQDHHVRWYPEAYRKKCDMGQYLYLTWVCRRWRFLILDQSKFWTFIHVSRCFKHGDDFIREVLLRSKGAKLDVDAIGWLRDPSISPGLLKAICLKFPHIRSLRISPSKTEWPVLKDLLGKFTPALQNLEIMLHDLNEPGQVARWPENASIFEDATLRILHFATSSYDGYLFHWPAFTPRICATLKEVRINPYFSTSVENSFKMLLDFMESLHVADTFHLKILQEQRFDIPSVTEGGSVGRRRNMPNLSDLLLVGGNIIRLLDYLNVPKLRRLALGTNKMTTDQQIISDSRIGFLEFSSFSKVKMCFRRRFRDRLNASFCIHASDDITEEFGCDRDGLSGGRTAWEFHGSPSAHAIHICCEDADAALLDHSLHGLRDAFASVTRVTFSSPGFTETGSAGQLQPWFDCQALLLRQVESVREISIQDQPTVTKLLQLLGKKGPEVCPILEELEYIWLSSRRESGRRGPPTPVKRSHFVNIAKSRKGTLQKFYVIWKGDVSEEFAKEYRKHLSEQVKPYKVSVVTNLEVIIPPGTRR